MLVETHIIQNFAPSNLNRDDTGSPKDCEFGGYRRARISSQSMKRAIRKSDTFAKVLAGRGAVRTRRLIAEIAERVSGEAPPPRGMLSDVAEIFKAGGLERASRREEEENTSILLFLASSSIDRLAERIRTQLSEVVSGTVERARILDEIGQELEDSARCPDVALFGRMIEVGDATPFGKRNLRVDSACQVAHPLSTHEVSLDFDYYTAVDDLNREGMTGAGMIGTVEFNSACFYRYANVDVDQLTLNLGGDAELARQTLTAFLQATVEAIPTGKQNSMAAHNPPSLVMTVVRQAGLWSLANAFVRPVRPGRDGDLIVQSVRALDGYWAKLSAMYGVGASGIEAIRVATMEPEALSSLSPALVPAVSAAIEGAVANAFGVGESV